MECETRSGPNRPEADIQGNGRVNFLEHFENNLGPNMAAYEVWAIDSKSEVRFDLRGCFVGCSGLRGHKMGPKCIINMHMDM